MLGLLLIATFYITGRGVGATGGTKSAVIATVENVAPEYAERSTYYAKYFDEDSNPMKNWLTFETIGILAGAFLSGALSGRVRFRVQHPPQITTKKRLYFAALGGLLFGISIRARLYQWGRHEWLSGAIAWRFHNHDLHFWHCLHLCLLF